MEVGKFGGKIMSNNSKCGYKHKMDMTTFSGQERSQRVVWGMLKAYYNSLGEDIHVF